MESLAYRGVRGDILRDACGLAGGVVDDVPVYACAGCVLRKIAGPANPHQLPPATILFRVQHVATFWAELEGDRFQLLVREPQGWLRRGGGRHCGFRQEEVRPVDRGLTKEADRLVKL